MTTYERFLAKIDRSGGAESCHVWTSAVDRDGYGWFWADGLVQRPHRWLLGHLRGWPLQVGKMACHTCDNPSCCNPAHLYVGTAADNARDRVSRGRGKTNGFEKKTRCKNDHPFDTVNTYVDTRGFRQCRACAALSRQRYEARRKAVRS